MAFSFFGDIRLQSLSEEFPVRLTNVRGRFDRSLQRYEMADTGVYRPNVMLKGSAA